MGGCCTHPNPNAVADESSCTGSSTLGRCVGNSTTKYADATTGQQQQQDVFRVLSLDGLSPDGDAQALHTRRRKPWDDDDVASSRTGPLSAKGTLRGSKADGLRGSKADGLRGSKADGLRGSKSDGLRGSKADGLNGTGSRDPNADGLNRSGRGGAGINGTIFSIDETNTAAGGLNGTIKGRLGNSVHRGDQLGEDGEYYYDENGERQASEDEDDDGMAEVASSSAVKVAVMVRPLLDFELKKDGNVRDIVTVVPPSKIKMPRKPHGTVEDGYNFDFDRVYKADNAQAGKLMFAQLVLPVVERFCQGFNGTVLAYGQTGSGKTYTMGTSSSMKDMVSKEPQGVIPRTMNVLFNYVELASQKYDLALKAIYFEIYNEQIYDLLSKDQAKVAGSKLDVREKPNGEVFIEGATEVKVTTKDEVAAIIDLGNANRATAAHKMNAESSRSHAILVLVLEQRAKLSVVNQVPEDLRYLRSKLCLVDLAGSERQKETGTTGDRFSEGVNINRGLLELGNVINALTEGKKRTHVPYRNSKLTRVLQDSLGGNSETLFLACVSPADSNHDHTVSTLRYAQRARAIRNNLRLNNKLSLEEEVEYLRNLVLQLQQENAVLKRENEGLNRENEGLKNDGSQE